MVACLYVHKGKINTCKKTFFKNSKIHSDRRTCTNRIRKPAAEAGLLFFFSVQNRAERDTHAHFRLANKLRENSHRASAADSNSTYQLKFPYLYRTQPYRKSQLQSTEQTRDIETDSSEPTFKIKQRKRRCDCQVEALPLVSEVGKSMKRRAD